jgi:hypothetical protein
MVALTAVLQPDESLPTLRCRHCSASFPPGVTPEQFDMKSDRQLERMALCCSDVTCAAAGAVAAIDAASASRMLCLLPLSAPKFMRSSPPSRILRFEPSPPHHQS